jgi:predicted PurR-regulated permease PerM
MDKPDRQTLFKIFFFTVFIFILLQFLRLLWPFFTPLLAATTLSLIFFPVHRKIHSWMPSRPNVSAALSTLLILVIVVVPVLGLAWLLVKESAVVYPAAQQWVQSIRANPSEGLLPELPAPMQRFWERASYYLTTWEVDPQDIFLKNVDQLGGRISAFGTRMIKNLLFLVFDVGVTAFTLFFFFRDGPRIGKFVTELIPMEHVHKQLVLGRLAQTLSAVVRGVFITASVQGLLAGIGFALAGLRFSVLLGFTSAFLALIPFVGPTFVWLPTAAYLFLSGSPVKGLLLFLWGALVVSLADNFLRPILIGEKAKLPVFLLFFGILGGLQMYGPIGILMGPLIIAGVLAFAKIYREQFHRPAAGAPPDDNFTS